MNKWCWQENAQEIKKNKQKRKYREIGIILLNMYF